MSGTAREIILVCARARNGTIGRDGALPWHIPEDLRRFKALTTGKPMIMGRKTFESFAKPLPGRRHIVMTRDPHWSAPGAEVVASVDTALACAGSGDGGSEKDGSDIAVIGGAQVYAAFLERADRIELTEIHADIAGDTAMPPLGPGWREIAREDHAAGIDAPAFAFVTLTRHL